MLNREIYLIADGTGSRLGEFLVELNFDQPGILATLSNIFAEHDVNIINIAIDAGRQNLHFIVDLTLVSDDQIKNIVKSLQMFAFVKKVRYRVSTTSIFVPRWIIHVINGKSSISIERDLIPLLQEPAKLAEELARRDAKTVKELAASVDPLVLDEAIYIAQLRGLYTVENTEVREGRLSARLCNLAQPMARRYVEVFVKELGAQAKLSDEGICLTLEA
ncbi:MAG: ACT domain-containing protein [Pyrobaculum sp.]